MFLPNNEKINFSDPLQMLPENEKTRKLFYFQSLGIPHLFSLGKVELLASTNPFPPHVHKNSFELCVHYEGSQYYELNGTGNETHTGDILISFPNEHHSTGNKSEEKSKFFYLIFECMPDTQNFMGLDDASSDYVIHKLFSITNRIFRGSAVLRPILEEVMNTYSMNPPLGTIKIKSLMLNFFYELCYLIDHSVNNSSMPKDIEFACDYILENITQSPKIDTIAEKVFLSTSQFKKKFKQHTLYAPHDYMLRQKITISCDMLQYTYIPITKIAFELDFSSSQQFSKVFKKYIGVSPSQFRTNKNMYL